MRTGTIVSLAASAALGIGALIVARIWLPQSGHPSPQNPLTAPQEGVPVVVAAVDIPYGTKLDAGRLTVVRLPAGSAPRGAFSDPAQILKEAGGPPVVLTPIVAHEPLLPDKLSGPGARPTVSAVITEGMRAYTIGISDVAGVGGHVLPGDRVDVMLTRSLPVPAELTSKYGDVKAYAANVVLQDVRILGMDLNHDPTSTQAATAHTATLEVSVQDAQKLSVAADAGTLSLALRRTGNAEVAATRTVDVRDVVGQVGLPRLLQVSHHHAGSAGPAPIFIQTHSVVVVHGDTASSVDVPAERFGGGA